MLAGKRIIAVIPARGGSKSVPGKNLRPLKGKPLLKWAVDSARQLSTIDRVIVSTDDAEIARVGRESGAEVYPRPAHLATDTALVVDALQDLVATLRREGESAEWMMLLEPTCPLRSQSDIEECLSLLETDRFDSVATFKAADLNPHRAWKIQGNTPETFIAGAIPWLPRQALPLAYQLNGAVYVFRMNLLDAASRSVLPGKVGAVIMPKERSYDIDEAMDFTIVEALLEEGRNE